MLFKFYKIRNTKIFDDCDEADLIEKHYLQFPSIDKEINRLFRMDFISSNIYLDISQRILPPFPNFNYDNI